ncbi:AraC family transcriptional regulator with amidase-like domain [Serratia fonticola]|jgi:transcriptional regulator GlxA family with amidase domain|uniref:AraC family transcriptional regulator with amidase-like domain n=1 Tax=Serratia fonticola TaxID=47917 RepID=A0A559TBC1_SERFO|nr:helix-turn-helix domain-containing protein [Serratia fonticola]TQI80557.1 AraC family transcriptional regulator with amidase-like domain [Serratia fonticola]TQI97418.1 AraC family transcriptional regulator with amidase-like domain [Serratia fonticola]TVZ71914.1 AraC family transcriptional regulator with amidase-like domain [Serratia fonticola]
MSSSPRTVAILATEGFSTFHFSVPLILFGDTVTDLKLFQLQICAEIPGMVWSGEGTAVRADYGLEAFTKADIVIVPFWGDVRQCPSPALLAALVEAKSKGAQLVGLCLGTFVLAYTGLLNGYHAATHWEYEDDFRDLFPHVNLDLNRLYVEDGGIITSAGTAAALDCCLQLIRQFYGTHVANQIARRMVAPPYREGGQSQYIQQMVPYRTSDERINQLIEYLRKNIHLPHHIEALAGYVSMSRRTLTRRFHDTTGMSIVEWITTERLRRSQELLENTTLTVERVAEVAGFQSTVTFRQVFRSKTGVSPVEWRKTFTGNKEEM